MMSIKERREIEERFKVLEDAAKSSVNQNWLHLQISKLIRRIGILEKARDVTKPDERSVLCELRDKTKQLEKRLDRAVEQIINLHDQVGNRDVGNEVIKNEEQITKLWKKVFDEEMTREEMEKVHDRISHAFDRLDQLVIDNADLRKRAREFEKWRAGTQGDPTEDVWEAPSEDIDRYRCPLCKTQQWGLATGFAMNCSCGAKLQLSHHGLIMCSFHKSYDAEDYKV